MEFQVYRKPCMLLETVELVYSYVNQVPAEQLTESGEYCIPAREIPSIREAVCGPLDLENEELQFYFKGVPVDGKEQHLSCLACCMVYSTLNLGCSSVEETVRFLKNGWFLKERPFRVCGINGIGLDLTAADTGEFTTLAREIARLPVPQAYQLQLVEVFSDFTWHLDRLMAYLRPAAERLEPLLAPWVARAIPRMEEWERYLQDPSAMQTMLRKIGLKQPEIRRLELAMRYFFPFGGPGEFQHPQAHLSLHMGVGIPPGKDAPQAADFLHDWEFNALRLLAHPDRARMLRAMTGQAMSVPGAVSNPGPQPRLCLPGPEQHEKRGPPGPGSRLQPNLLPNRLRYCGAPHQAPGPLPEPRVTLPGLPSIKNPLQKRRRHLTSSLSAGTIGMTSITFLTFGREAP